MNRQNPDIRSLLRSRIREAALAGGAGEAVPPENEIVLELPRETAHGDLACPLPFALARSLRRKPAEIAELIRAKFAPDELIERVETAGGGYLNFFLGDKVWGGILQEVEARGEAYGTGSSLAGERILVEFVSANPTGPLLAVNARHGAFGEALCRCLEAAGASVDREYYINDAGSQVRNLALSVEARWRESLGEDAQIPADGYQGEYVRDVAARARAKLGDALLAEDAESRIAKLSAFSLEEMLAGQRAGLARMRVEFARWFRESELHSSGKIAETLSALREREAVYDSEGAAWFKATEHGDDKDRVLVRSNGQPTYLLPDVAYHMDKFARGYSRLINVVGADHQTEMVSLQRALGVLGGDLKRMEVIIVQWVNLKRGGEKVVMSKRAGNLATLEELLDDVGVDAARFFFLLRAPSSHLDFDIELAKTKSLENPVYYIQYAHARLCSLLGYAAQREIKPPSAASVSSALLAEPEARFVLRKLARYPLVLEKAARSRMPHILTHEALELAQAVHQFYTRYRVVGSGTAETQGARLALIWAAKQTVANQLGVLGVAAPERM